MIMIIFFPSPGQAADRGLQLRRARPGRLLLGGHRGVAGVQSQHRAAAPLPGEDSTEDVTEEAEAAITFFTSAGQVLRLPRPGGAPAGGG